MAVCSEIHTKHVNTAVWAERGIVEGSAGGTCSDRWAAEDEMIYGQTISQQRIVSWKWVLQITGIYLGMLHILKNNRKYLVASLYTLVTRKHYTKSNLKLNTGSRLRLGKTSVCERDVVFVLVTRVLASCWRGGGGGGEANRKRGKPLGR